MQLDVRPDCLNLFSSSDHEVTDAWSKWTKVCKSMSVKQFLQSKSHTRQSKTQCQSKTDVYFWKLQE